MYKYDKTLNSLFRTATRVGKAIEKANAQVEREQRRNAREAERRLAAYNRMIKQNERERIRRTTQQEVALRRAERERLRAVRAQERTAKLQQKLQEQQQLEEEIADIEEDNELWTNIQSFIDTVIRLEDVKASIAKCDYEQSHNVKDGSFEKPYPKDLSVKQQAQMESDAKFDLKTAQKEFSDAKDKLNSLNFNEIEPSVDSILEILKNEAKENIKAFFPWTQKRLRKEYISSHLDTRFEEMHNSWQLKKDGFEEHKRELISLVNEKKIKVEELLKAKDTYLILRTKELFDSEIKLWEKERDIFYNNLRQTFKNVIDGDYDYVITAINSIFLEDELPMEYFADVVYDEQHGKVYVDLDLPEIEDIPNKKIVLTSSGKKSIRLKSQTDMRADYANCVLGLSMYIAYLIFNVSIKVSEIELMAYTQRKEDNSAIATDQYVFVIN